ELRNRRATLRYVRPSPVTGPRPDTAPAHARAGGEPTGPAVRAAGVFSRATQQRGGHPPAPPARRPHRAPRRRVCAPHPAATCGTASPPDRYGNVRPVAFPPALPPLVATSRVP